MNSTESKSSVKAADKAPHKCDGSHVCGVCGTRKFDEPNSVGGVLVVIKKRFHHDRILLCLRANEPAEGDWTLPGGHGRNGEDTRGTARRHLKKEAGLDAELTGRLEILKYTAHIYFNEDRSVYMPSINGEDNKPDKPGKTEATHVYRVILRGQRASEFLRSLQAFDKNQTKEVQLFTLKEISRLNLAFPFVLAARDAYRKTKHRKNCAAIEVTTDDWWQGSANEPADSRSHPSGKLSSLFKKPASRFRHRASARRQIASLQP